MILASRPLRFLTLVLGGWVGVRAAMLWPVAELAPELIHAVAPPVAAATRPGGAPFARLPERTRRIRAIARPVGRTATPAPESGGDLVVAAAQRVDPPRLALASGDPTHPAGVAPLVPGVDPPPVFRGSRWSGSAWAIVRPDGRATPFASQLGGSQAGARIAYAVDGARRVALYARASTAVDAAQREAAVGVDWRPTGLPVHLVAERRIGIEGVRGGTAIGAVGGVGPTRVAGPVRVEGYAQAGVIVRAGSEGFADGSLRVTAPVTPRVDLGLGTWGGAQKDAARLDVGPTVGVTLPVAGHALRVTADWRQRVAGDARPGSGPAVSVGVDF